jgi:hypothetical protein
MENNVGKQLMLLVSLQKKAKAYAITNDTAHIYSTSAV